MHVNNLGFNIYMYSCAILSASDAFQELIADSNYLT